MNSMNAVIRAIFLRLVVEWQVADPLIQAGFVMGNYLFVSNAN